MRYVAPSLRFAASAACLAAAVVVVGCAGPQAPGGGAVSTRPATPAAPAPATAPVSTTVPVTHAAHNHHAGMMMANGAITFGDYFIQTPTNMNGVHAGTDGLLCQSARMPKMLQIVILKRSDATAPVPKLVSQRSPADPPHSVLVPAGTKISQVRIGVFQFYRGFSTDQERHLKIITLSGADDDNDIFIRAAAADDDQFADLQTCIATFRYAAPEAAAASRPAP